MAPGSRWSRRRFLGRLAGGAAALTLGPTALAACGSGRITRKSSGSEGAVLRFGLEVPVASFHPFRASGAAALDVRGAEHRGLLGLDESGRIAPELAKSWRQLDATTYEFVLRPGARFHNGDPVTAADVAHSFALIQDVKSAAELYTAMKAVDRVEPGKGGTITIRLHEPRPTFLQNLATPYAPVVSAKSDPGRQRWIGCGPFRLIDVQTSSKYSFRKFADYYRPGLPRLDGIDYTVIPDDNQRASSVETAQVDMIEYVPYPNWSTMQGIPGRSIAGSSDAVLLYLLFNVKSMPQFRDARVRRAIGHAMNRQQVVDSAYFGHGRPCAGLPIPRGSRYYVDEYERTAPPDLAQARSLLAAAGYPNGFATNLMVLSTQPDHVAGGLVAQQNLARIGIRCTIQQVDIPTRVARGNSGDYQMFINGTGADLNDPDGLSRFLVGSGPSSYVRSYGYDDPDLDALFGRGGAEPDPQKRMSIYTDVQKIFQQEASIVPLATRDQGFALQSYVHDFRTLPGFLTSYSVTQVDRIALDLRD